MGRPIARKGTGILKRLFPRSACLALRGFTKFSVVIARATCGANNSPAISLRIPLFNIYLIEDSPVIRENLIATLEELLPVKVVGTAEDESSAVQWLCDPRHAVDLVIVDIFLRSGSGMGVLKAAQALPQRHRLVVLSNYATAYMRRECLALGADRVFDKSNEIDTLIEYCSQLVASEHPGSAPSVLP